MMITDAVGRMWRNRVISYIAGGNRNDASFWGEEYGNVG